MLGPAASVLLSDAAARARRAEDRAEREVAESNLSRVLRAVLAECDAVPDHGDLLAETYAAARHVHIARRFYNDTVTAIHTARSSRLVGALHLAGHARLPTYFEMDDEPPNRSTSAGQTPLPPGNDWRGFGVVIDGRHNGANPHPQTPQCP